MQMTRRVIDLTYRGLDLTVRGTFFSFDGSLIVDTVELRQSEGNFYKVIENSAIEEELTAICVQKIIDDEAAAAREAKAAVGRE